MNTQHTDLGVVVSKLWRLSEGEGYEYDMDGSGECGPMIHAHFSAQALRIVQSHGFATYDEFMEEVDRRTSPRWNYFHGCTEYAPDDDEAPFPLPWQSVRVRDGLL